MALPSQAARGSTQEAHTTSRARASLCSHGKGAATSRSTLQASNVSNKTQPSPSVSWLQALLELPWSRQHLGLQACAQGRSDILEQG